MSSYVNVKSPKELFFKLEEDFGYVPPELWDDKSITEVHDKELMNFIVRDFHSPNVNESRDTLLLQEAMDAIESFL